MAPRPPDELLTPEQLFLANLPLIEQVVQHTCRRHRLSRQEAEDFGQEVNLKMMEDDYAVFRKFQGKSSLRTYLTMVVKHQMQDYLNHIWGKWRPTAEAERLGPLAVRLEMMLVREKFTFDEACEILRTNHHVEESLEDLTKLAAKLPPRNPLRRMEGEEALENRPAEGESPDRRILGKELESRRRKVLQLLRQALASLPAEDRLIARMRGEFQIVQIARTLHLEQKPLYRRIEKILKGLRTELERQGVRPEEINEILGNPERS